MDREIIQEVRQEIIQNFNRLNDEEKEILYDKLYNCI